MGDAKGGRKQGMQGMFNFGRRYGAVLAVLDVLAIHRDTAEPSVWKRAVGVSSDKGTSLAAARSLWPDAAHLLTRVKDEARAKAALIARHGMRMRPTRRAA